MMGTWHRMRVHEDPFCLACQPQLVIQQKSCLRLALGTKQIRINVAQASIGNWICYWESALLFLEKKIYEKNVL